MMINLIQSAKADIFNALNAACTKAIECGELKGSIVPDYIIEIPKESGHGDFASNIALQGAKEFKAPPRKIAEIIVSHLNLDDTFIEKTQIAGPGFINFYLSDDYYSSTLKAIESENDNYGKTSFGQNKKIMVEFISANPTGPMHMGNARGGALGDCLSSVLSWAGYDVTREFYINDAGNQIDKFGFSLEARYMQLFLGEGGFPFPEDGYFGDDIKELAARFKEINADKYVDMPSQERRDALIRFGLEKNIARIKEDLKEYRIHFDIWFNESKLHNNGELNETIEILKQNGYTYEKDGALWYKATAFGAEKDDVLIRANGYPTYFAADIAYHRNKFLKRGFDRVINIWGADHHGHVARLKGAMDAIGLEGSKLDIVLMQLVRLMRDGVPVKMSKRTGKSITLRDLLDETSVDAARYFFNLRQADSHFDYDMDLAVEQSGQNPVYYVQYAHARICSIMRSLKDEGIKPRAINNVNLSLLKEQEERELIKNLSELPEEIKLAAQDYDPSRLTRYLYETATLFHKFYTACRVKCDDEELMQARIKLIECTRTVIKNVLNLMAVSAPEKM